MDFNTILQAITTIAVALIGFFAARFKDGIETAVKTSAEEGVKAQMKEITWPADLAKELQKTRGVARQQLRYTSYGKLWSKLRPLAIYDDALINKQKVEALSLELTNWYFSEDGGLLLTPQARNFYFALQDLLRSTSRTPRDWYADRTEERQSVLKNEFVALLTKLNIQDSLSAFNYMTAGKFDDWQNQAAAYGEQWQNGIKALAACWDDLDDRERFVVLQQVGSILRTSLTVDLESRLS